MRDRLRTTFEEVPEAYDRARPTYSPELFDDLVELTGLRPGARLLGTGQATAPLAERGFAITCVELGERLAAVARGKLAAFPAVEVVNAPFESGNRRRRASTRSWPSAPSTGSIRRCAT